MNQNMIKQPNRKKRQRKLSKNEYGYIANVFANTEMNQ